MIHFYCNAAKGKLNQLHPANKMLFVAVFMLSALFSTSIVFLLSLGAGIFIFTKWASQMPVLALLRLMKLPVFFLCLGVLPLLFDQVTGNPPAGSQIFNTSLAVTSGSLHQTLVVLSRSLSMMGTMYWFILSVPLAQLIEMFRNIKLPAVFIEILVGVYRNIFLMISTVEKIKASQTCRLGYSSFLNSFQSMALLLGQTLVLSMHKAELHQNSLVARGYQDIWPTIHRPCPFSSKYFAVWFFTSCMLSASWYFCFKFHVV